MNEPPAPLWDRPLAEAPLVFLDLEMTGLDAKKDHVVEMCLERWIGDHLESELTTLVKPPARAGGNVQFHGLSEDVLREAPPFDALADRVEEILRDGIPVAHAAEWDVSFLRAEMERAKKPIAIDHFLDTLAISRRAFGLDSHSLASLCAHFGIDPGTAHRAKDDVRALREIFQRCVAALEPKSPRDLWHVRIADGHARPAIVEACTNAIGKPIKLVYRTARAKTQTIKLVVKEVTSTTPPRIVGYEMESRARRELRADRILQVEPLS